MRAMEEMDLSHKRVMIRVDFNVPMQDGAITSMARIDASLATINMALAKKAKVMLVSHLGRPKEGCFDSSLSLAPIAKALSERLNQAVTLTPLLEPADLEPGQCCLMENIRFAVGEKANDEGLSKQLASMCDVFINDAFSVSHRKAASVVGVAQFATEIAQGLLMEQEVNALKAALSSPKRPLVAIVGGSKVSTKFRVLDALLDKVDTLVVGGGMANTLLKSSGVDIGQSLFESDWVDSGRTLIQKASDSGKSLVLPKDAIVSTSLDKPGRLCQLDSIQKEDMILDIGPETVRDIEQVLSQACTIVWNGPMGVFEKVGFEQGTMKVGQAICQSSAFSIAGGGDTLAAMAQLGLSTSYQSTAGGAFLEFLEGRVLPGLEVLQSRALERV